MHFPLEKYGYQSEPPEHIKYEYIYNSAKTDKFVRLCAIFLSCGIVIRCRSPPLVLRFQLNFEN